MQTYEHYSIKESHCDYFGKLKLKQIFLMMQDTGFKDLQSNANNNNTSLGSDLAFLIRRAIVNVINAPKAYDEVNVGTSQVAHEGLTYTRDFVFECNNEVCITATTQWFLCKISDKTIVRPTTDTITYSQDAVGLTIGNKPVIDIEFAKEYNVVKAGYSLMDTNMHVNNSEYVAWACDAPFAFEFLEKGSYLFDIYFRKEVLMDSVVSLRQQDNSVCGVTEEEINFIASFT